MKRDDEYLRQILLELEASEETEVYVAEFIGGSLEDRRRNYHIRLAADAGFLKEQYEDGYRLTNAGHDYLDAIRDEGVWSRTKAAVAETGGSATLEIIKSLAIGFLKAKIEKHTGITL